MADCISCDG